MNEMEAKKRYAFGINVLEGDGGLTVPQHIDLIRQVGWQAFFTMWTHDQIETWAEAGARNGLIYQSIHAPFGHAEEMWRAEEGREVERTMIECLTDCARFGIPVMVLHPFKPFTGFTAPAPTEAGLTHFGHVIEAAERLGVKLGLENVEYVEYLDAVMERYHDAPALGFCYDTGHELCYNGGQDLMARYGGRLCHTHINDNLGMTGALPDWHEDLHLPMGDGKVDWGRVMDRIDASPYEGVLMCELTRKNRPGKHTHDAYAALPIADFYKLALDRMRRVADRTIGARAG